MCVSLGLELRAPRHSEAPRSTEVKCLHHEVIISELLKSRDECGYTIVCLRNPMTSNPGWPDRI